MQIYKQKSANSVHFASLSSGPVNCCTFVGLPYTWHPFQHDPGPVCFLVNSYMGEGIISVGKRYCRWTHLNPEKEDHTDLGEPEECHHCEAWGRTDRRPKSWRMPHEALTQTKTHETTCHSSHVAISRSQVCWGERICSWIHIYVRTYVRTYMHTHIQAARNQNSRSRNNWWGASGATWRLWAGRDNQENLARLLYNLLGWLAAWDTRTHNMISSKPVLCL